VNAVPTDRISYFHDEALPPLTRFYYRVTNVDSSGNESVVPSNSTVSVARIAVAHHLPRAHGRHHAVVGGARISVFLHHGHDRGRSDVLCTVLNADGSAPVDADGQGTTLGDFTMRGTYYAAGPSMSGWRRVRGCRSSHRVGVQDAAADSAGSTCSTRPARCVPASRFKTQDPIWSSALITDLNNDGHMEMAFGSQGNRFYVMRENGQEWLDGDSNPATKGVFKVLGSAYNVGSPGAADIDGDGLPNIVYGSYDSKLLRVGRPTVRTSRASRSRPMVPSHAHRRSATWTGAGDVTPEIVFATASDSLTCSSRWQAPRRLAEVHPGRRQQQVALARARRHEQTTASSTSSTRAPTVACTRSTATGRRSHRGRTALQLAHVQRLGVEPGGGGHQR